jgi:ABC-type uncharacterized transport system permease subunit
LSAWYLSAMLIYGGLAMYFWVRRGRAGSGGVRLIEHISVIGALSLHGWLLQHSMLDGGGLNLNLANALSLTVLLAVIVYWLGSLRYALHGLQGLVLAIAAGAVVLPYFAPTPHVAIHSEFPAFRWHVFASFLAYSLFTVAALHAAVMAMAEKSLHHHTAPPLRIQLPPLLTLEKMLFRLIAAGFVLLTATLVTGVFFSEEAFGKPFTFSHKTLFALISWLIFGGLLLGRRIYGWRGRTASHLTLLGFLMLLLAYLGTKFVLEVVLGRY